MKKSIFLFFAAILCAMSVSAKVIYFKPNSNWAAANANFYAHVWGGDGATSPVKFTPVATDPDVYEAEIGTHTSIIFLRMNPAKNVTSGNMWTHNDNGGPMWNRMGNLSIPTNGNNCCTIKDGEWSQEKDDASSHVTWSTYTPPTEVVIPDRYITGSIAGGWNANEVKMTYDEVTETYSHTFTAVAAGEEYEFKVTDGTWGKSWGGADVSPAIEGVTTNGDGNAVFTLSTGGDVTITFKDSKIQLTTTGSFTPVETFDYYVVGSLNGWDQNDEDYGMSDEDADGVYEKEVTLVAGSYQLKVKSDGNDWYGYANVEGTYVEVSEAETDGNVELTLDAEKTFTVLFNSTTKKIAFEGLTVPTPTYTVTLHNEVGAELEGAGEYEEGSVATVIAPEEWDGFIFVSWVDEEGNGVSDDATTTVTVNQDITLTALYAMMMPLEVTDLEIVMDPVFALVGTTELAGGTLSLQLVVDASAEPGEDGFPLTEDSQIWLGEDTQYEFLEGVALIDMENNAAQAFVLAADDWGMIYYFDIEMSAAAPAEPTEVVVENAIITVEEQSDGMGGTYELVNVTAEWNGTLLKLEGIEKNFEGFLQITQIVDEAADDWYIWMAMSGTVTTVDNVLTVSGEFTNNLTSDVYNVTISGTLPADEPEVPTALDNVDTTVAPVKAIVNGQLVIVKDGVKYNAQGAVVK